MTQKNVGRRLFAWWQDPASAPRDLFADNFVFDGGIPGFEDFIWWVRQKPPWARVKLLEAFETETRSVVMFEGVDPATCLCHRIVWILHLEAGLVSRLTQTVATIAGD